MWSAHELHRHAGEDEAEEKREEEVEEEEEEEERRVAEGGRTKPPVYTIIVLPVCANIPVAACTRA